MDCVAMVSQVCWQYCVSLCLSICSRQLYAASGCLLLSSAECVACVEWVSGFACEYWRRVLTLPLSAGGWRVWCGRPVAAGHRPEKGKKRFFLSLSFPTSCVPPMWFFPLFIPLGLTPIACRRAWCSSGRWPSPFVCCWALEFLARGWVYFIGCTVCFYDWASCRVVLFRPAGSLFYQALPAYCGCFQVVDGMCL